jgi:hypothetical protein
MKPQKVRQEESQDEYVAPLATLPKVKVSLTHAGALLPSADLACSGAASYDGVTIRLILLDFWRH